MPIFLCVPKTSFIESLPQLLLNTFLCTKLALKNYSKKKIITRIFCDTSTKIRDCFWPTQFFQLRSHSKVSRHFQNQWEKMSVCNFISHCMFLLLNVWKNLTFKTFSLHSPRGWKLNVWVKMEKIPH